METSASEIADIAGRLATVQDVIAQACKRAGRDPGQVTLVAVSKKHPPERVAAAIAAGVRTLGENRVEEAVSKIPAVARLTPVPVAWHLVGHVQSRKARHTIHGFALLHSLDSVRLADRLNRLLAEQDRDLDVLLEVNVSGEAAKYGWHAHRWRDDAGQRAALWQDVERILTLPRIHVKGLMTMAPIVEEPETARPVFVALRGLRDALAEAFPAGDWSELSMGMTDDYPVAVEEGATLVRIGRAIFGPRPA
jgi:pyridoxal phosphate enzyme (YggS family)